MSLGHVLFGAMKKMNKLFNTVLTFLEVKFLQDKYNTHRNFPNGKADT